MASSRRDFVRLALLRTPRLNPMSDSIRHRQAPWRCASGAARASMAGGANIRHLSRVKPSANSRRIASISAFAWQAIKPTVFIAGNLLGGRRCKWEALRHGRETLAALAPALLSIIEAKSTSRANNHRPSRSEIRRRAHRWRGIPLTSCVAAAGTLATTIREAALAVRVVTPPPDAKSSPSGEEKSNKSRSRNAAAMQSNSSRLDHHHPVICVVAAIGPAPRRDKPSPAESPMGTVGMRPRHIISIREIDQSPPMKTATCGERAWHFINVKAGVEAAGDGSRAGGGKLASCLRAQSSIKGVAINILTENR